MKKMTFTVLILALTLCLFYGCGDSNSSKEHDTVGDEVLYYIIKDKSYYDADGNLEYVEVQTELNEEGIPVTVHYNQPKWGSGVFQLEYSDADGTIVCRSNTKSQNMSFDCTVIYNEHGDPIQELDFIPSNTVYTYDSQGCKTEIIYTADEGGMCRSTYQYNEAGQIIQYTCQNEVQNGFAGARDVVETYEYDEYGVIKRYHRLGRSLPGSDDILEEYVYDYENTYNKEGQLIEQSLYQDGDKKAKETFEYKGNVLISVNRTQWVSFGGTTVQRDYYTNYDENGNVIQYKYCEDSKESEREEYVYDQNDNLITQFSYCEGVLDGYIEYSYFEKPLALTQAQKKVYGNLVSNQRIVDPCMCTSITHYVDKTTSVEILQPW